MRSRPRHRLTRRVRSLGLAAATLGVASSAPAVAHAQRAADVRPAATLRVAADPRLSSTLDPATLDSLAAAVAEARRRGLPEGPLVAKALEGIEKGAPGARIQGAVRAMLSRLQKAREGLAPVVSEAELVAGADALQAGVPQPTLRALRKLSPRRSTATALGVLAQLVSRGVPVEKAEETVKTLLSRGGGDRQLLALERKVNGDIALGLSPDAALELNSKAFIPALPPSVSSGGTGNAAAANGDAGAGLSSTQRSRP